MLVMPTAADCVVFSPLSRLAEEEMLVPISQIGQIRHFAVLGRKYGCNL